VTDDWYERELAFSEVLIIELQRLKRRARSRWPLVVMIGILLTAAVVWKVARKPERHRARIILAVTEGELATGRDASPLHELQAYISTVLLSDEKLLKIVEKYDLFPLRKTQGNVFALTELRDLFEIHVWRNYFQYGYAYDERRTARVAVVVTAPNAEFAYELAQELTTAIVASEGARRAEAALELGRQAADVAAAARARVTAANVKLTEATRELTRAEQSGTPIEATMVRLRIADLSAEARDVEERFFAIEQSMSNEALQTQVTEAGLALTIEVVDERRPPPPDGDRMTPIIIVGVVAFLVFLPLTGIVIGAFDTRIHDVVDVMRLSLPVLGHVPGFPGDRVGALADRGVDRRRMKGSR
jgi:hypothetical protein